MGTGISVLEKIIATTAINKQWQCILNNLVYYFVGAKCKICGIQRNKLRKEISKGIAKRPSMRHCGI